MAVHDLSLIGCQAGWRKYDNNPVIGEEDGFSFDNHVLKVGNKYRMYYSWRTHYSVAVVESEDGFNWGEPMIVLGPRPETKWEDDINRPTVVYRNNKFHMWYSGQTVGKELSSDSWTDVYLEASTNDKGTSHIGYATSDDGINWTRFAAPVIKPDSSWEKQSIMCPTVIWDEEENVYKMWYSGGGWFEPDSIGFAYSTDGIHWTKHKANPVFKANSNNIWERERVAGPHIVKEDGWYYLFYIGYEDMFKARICLARSRDGIENWERHKANPIISPGIPGSWEAEAVYKPFVLYEPEDDRWLMWYNARKGTNERIGIAILEGRDLRFDQ